MAKGNLFQGQARGRVGDVVLSRLDGQQVSRVRNRNPRNPNTYRQRLQRAVAANIARLYSAGSDIFNHSWQGCKVGTGAQRRFMKRNMRLLRRLLLADIDNDALSVDSIARVGVPGLSVPVPFAGLQVSAGSMSQDIFSLNESSGGVFWIPRIPGNLAHDATIADYCRLVGLKPGSIFTFIAFNVKSSADYLAKVGNNDNNYDAVFPCLFEYTQLRLKESAITDTTPMSSARYGMMFDGVDDSQIGALLVFNGFRVTSIFGSAYAAGDTILTACIASKQNSPKRSTAFLMNASGSAHYGLTHQFISGAWDKSADLDGSDLILEGENFPADSPTPTPGVTVSVTPSLPITQSNAVQTLVLTKSNGREWTMNEVEALRFTINGNVVPAYAGSTVQWTVGYNLVLEYIRDTLTESLTVNLNAAGQNTPATVSAVSLG